MSAFHFVHRHYKLHSTSTHRLIPPLKQNKANAPYIDYQVERDHVSMWVHYNHARRTSRSRNDITSSHVPHKIEDTYYCEGSGLADFFI